MSVRSTLVMSAGALVLAAPILVATPSAGAGSPVTVAAQGDGSASMTWEAPVPLTDYTRGSAFVVDAHSATTVVWETVPGTMMSVRRAADGTWTQPEVIGESNATFGDPQVAADAQGNLTAVWTTQRDGFTDGVMAATWTAVAGWSEPVSISRDRAVADYPSDGKGPWGAAHLALAVSPGGAVVVAWDWAPTEVAWRA